MNSRPFRTIVSAIAVVLALGLSVSAQQPPRREPPPEYREFLAAVRLADPAARIKEIERIKAVYPGSVMAEAFEGAILDARVAMADSVDAVLELQKGRLAKAKGFDRVVVLYGSTVEILDHDGLDKFDKRAVAKAVEVYTAEGQKLGRDPDLLKSLPRDQAGYAGYLVPRFHLSAAMAAVVAGDRAKAGAALEAFRAEKGQADRTYHYVLGRTLELQGKDPEALDAYFEAAVENDEPSVLRARALHAKISGKPEAFDVELEKRLRALPYHPAAFKPSKPWQGKTVLAELFTGSECPPCVAADLGFDGLIEAFPSKYLVVLEYHLPIPRPDPMASYATQQRGVQYAVSSTPNTFFDGAARQTGGGPRGAAESKFKEYAAEIEAGVYEAPAVKVSVKASLRGDMVAVEFKTDKPVSTADYHLVLALSLIHI
jgi:thiol-disulfide isomerase/thioredoxin